MSDEIHTRGPMAGIRVLEFGQVAAGPYTGSLLADLGADVVKVERSGSGDGMRSWPPLTPNDEQEFYSENFASLNRNKRSIALDLKDPDHVARLKALCQQADVVVENFRPGVMDRLGVGYEALAKENPRLVFCSISGYGQTGPYATRGAFDVTVQAMSGLMSVTGESDSGPVKCGVPVGDFGAGLYAAYSIAAALLDRERSGKGRFIDVSMLGSLIGISALQTSEFFGSGQSAGRIGSAHPRNAPYQAFRARDDYFVIAAGNDKLWRSVCDIVGQPELADQPRFATQLDRAANQKELAAILEQTFVTQSAAHWIALMEEHGVPVSPINSFEDMLEDPHVKAMGIVSDLELPNGVKTRTTGFPVGIEGFEFSIRRNPPLLGEHNDEVFTEWCAPSVKQSA